MSRWIHLAAGCGIAVLAMSCAAADDAGAPAVAPATADAGPPAGEISMTQITVGGFTFDARVAGPADGEVALLVDHMTRYTER